ncbi:hypothetical protein STENM327S_07255 [Streptomyces tendae]
MAGLLSSLNTESTRPCRSMPLRSASRTFRSARIPWWLRKARCGRGPGADRTRKPLPLDWASSVGWRALATSTWPEERAPVRAPASGMKVNFTSSRRAAPLCVARDDGQA